MLSAFFSKKLAVFEMIFIFSPEWGGSQEPGRKPLDQKMLRKLPLQPRRGGRGAAETVAPPGLRDFFCNVF